MNATYYRKHHSTNEPGKKSSLRFVTVRTAKQVSIIMGISEQRVLQIQHRALKIVKDKLLEYWHETYPTEWKQESYLCNRRRRNGEAATR